MQENMAKTTICFIFSIRLPIGFFKSVGLEFATFAPKEIIGIFLIIFFFPVKPEIIT